MAISLTLRTTKGVPLTYAEGDANLQALAAATDAAAAAATAASTAATAAQTAAVGKLSSESLKTINGQSLVGSGDLTVSGGGSGITSIANAPDKNTVDLSGNTSISAIATSIAAKADSTSVATALAAKADASALAAKATLQTGVLAANTALAPNATAVLNAIAGIVNSAPSTLDTLNELAAALGNDPNFATTIASLIGTKLSASSLKTINGNSLVGSGDLATLPTVISGGTV